MWRSHSALGRPDLPGVFCHLGIWLHLWGPILNQAGAHPCREGPPTGPWLSLRLGLHWRSSHLGVCSKCEDRAQGNLSKITDTDMMLLGTWLQDTASPGVFLFPPPDPRMGQVQSQSWPQLRGDPHARVHVCSQKDQTLVTQLLASVPPTMRF